MVTIGKTLPPIGSALEIVLAPDLSVRVPWEHRDHFSVDNARTFFSEISGDLHHLPEESLRVDAMQRMADLRPQGWTLEQAQAALEQPFEWRAFCGADLPRLDGSADIRTGREPARGPINFADWTPELLAQRAARALADAGVTRVRVTGAERFEGARLTPEVRRDRDVPALVLEHDFGANHWAAVEAFRRAFARASDHLPPLFLTSTAGVEVSTARVDGSLPILERFAHIDNSKLVPHENSITDNEYTVLRDWTRARYGLELPRHAAYRALLALMSQPLHAMSADQVEGCLRAHEDLGTLTRFSADIFRRLLSRYQRPSGPLQIHLSTHLKLDGAPYLILKQLLGPEQELSIAASTYSGSGTLRGLAALNGIDVRLSKPQRVDRGVILRRQSVAGPPLPAPGEPTVIVEKGGKVVAEWLKSHSRAEVLDAIDSGRVVIIPHNREDLDALSKLLDRPFGTRCLNNTRCKREEARRIGERQILQAAEVTRYAWDAPIGAQELVVVGAGLIGGSVVDAALARNMDPANITVVDRDPEVRARYREQGCRVLASVEKATAVERERAVVINALPGSAGNLDRLLELSHDTIFISLTSGGKGLDWSSNATNLAYAEAPDRYWSTGYDWEHHRTHFPDEVFWRGDRRLRVVATGMPPNLIEEQWSQVFELTTDLVSACVLEGAFRPGEAAAVPDALDREMLALYRQHGGDRIAPFKGYDDRAWQDLLDDFERRIEVPVDRERPDRGFVLHDSRNPSRGFGHPGRRQAHPKRTPAASTGYETIFLRRK